MTEKASLLQSQPGDFFQCDVASLPALQLVWLRGVVVPPSCGDAVSLLQDLSVRSGVSVLPTRCCGWSRGLVFVVLWAILGDGWPDASSIWMPAVVDVYLYRRPIGSAG